MQCWLAVDNGRLLGGCQVHERTGLTGQNRLEPLCMMLMRDDENVEKVWGRKCSVERLRDETSINRRLGDFESQTRFETV